jgi:hypothetical protein
LDAAEDILVVIGVWSLSHGSIEMTGELIGNIGMIGAKEAI